MITIYLSSYRILGLTRWYQNNWNEPRSFCHKKLASWDGYEILILWGRKNIANMFGENIKNICATIRWFSLALVFHTSCACAFYKNETCSLSSYHMHHFRFWYVIDYWKYISSNPHTPDQYWSCDWLEAPHAIDELRFHRGFGDVVTDGVQHLQRCFCGIKREIFVAMGWSC